MFTSIAHIDVDHLRTHLPSVLDKADEGGCIVINRNTRTYILVSVPEEELTSATALDARIEVAKEMVGEKI